jgi:hypothetical protein
MFIDLGNSMLWDEWADAIKSFILKDWVTINLGANNISKNKKKELIDWGKSYIDQWIHCNVLFDSEERW